MTDLPNTNHSLDPTSSSGSASKEQSSSGSTTGSVTSSALLDGIKSLMQASRKAQVAILLARVHVLVQLSDISHARQALEKAFFSAEELEDKLLISRCHFWTGVLWIKHQNNPCAVRSFVSAIYIVDKRCPESLLLRSIFQKYRIWFLEFFSTTVQSPERAGESMQSIEHLMNTVLDDGEFEMGAAPMTADFVACQLGLDLPSRYNRYDDSDQAFDLPWSEPEDELVTRSDLNLADLLFQVDQYSPHSSSKLNTTTDDEPFDPSPQPMPPQSALSTESQRAFVGIDRFMADLSREVRGGDSKRKGKAEGANTKIMEHKATLRDVDAMKAALGIKPQPASPWTDEFRERLANRAVSTPEPTTKIAGMPKDAVLSDTLALEKVDKRIEVTTGRRKSIGEQLKSPPSPTLNQRPMSMGHMLPRRRMSADPQSPSPLRRSSLPG